MFKGLYTKSCEKNLQEFGLFSWKENTRERYGSAFQKHIGCHRRK